MFQYARGRALSLRHRVPLRLVTDMFEGYGLHSGFELARVFGVKAEVVSRDELKEALGWRGSRWIRRAAARYHGALCGGGNFVVEPSFRFHRELLDVLPPVYLHGYWQSPFYFSDVESDIRADFTFQEPLDRVNETVAKEIAAHWSVSVHVRRGDYVATQRNRAVYATCPPEYYLKAMGVMRDRHAESRFFVFSDDPAWVRETMSGKIPGLTVVEHNSGRSGFRDMQLMSLCRDNIIANSTFSWWGAWLNRRSDKLVVAPKKWFAEGSGLSEEDLIPGSWLRM